MWVFLGNPGLNGVPAHQKYEDPLILSIVLHMME